MSPKEARITAHVCSDGWIISYVEKNSLQIGENIIEIGKNMKLDITILTKNY